jgi:hypothetical protein
MSAVAHELIHHIEIYYFFENVKMQRPLVRSHATVTCLRRKLMNASNSSSRLSLSVCVCVCVCLASASLLLGLNLLHSRQNLLVKGMILFQAGELGGSFRRRH